MSARQQCRKSSSRKREVTQARRMSQRIAAGVRPSRKAWLQGAVDQTSRGWIAASFPSDSIHTFSAWAHFQYPPQCVSEVRRGRR